MGINSSSNSNNNSNSNSNSNSGNRRENNNNNNIINVRVQHNQQQQQENTTQQQQQQQQEQQQQQQLQVQVQVGREQSNNRVVNNNDAQENKRPRAISVGNGLNENNNNNRIRASTDMIVDTSKIRRSPEGSSPVLWCLIKSKTRQHNSWKEVKKSFWYEAREGKSFTIGRDSNCDLQLEDDRCSPLNAKIETRTTENGWGVFLNPYSRMYRLVGMQGKPSTQYVVSIGSVIKVGSISLEVTDMCTDETDDFAERFAVEIGSSSNGRNGSASSSSTSWESDKEKEEEQPNVEDSSVMDSSNVEESDGKDNQSNQEPEKKQDVELSDEAMCYICWGGVDEDNDEEKKKVKNNPMIRNPCGTCSGCSQYVHLQCLLTWISKSGSGHCSICNGVLPSHFASPPPNIELKIVRHRRGHSWVGTRRFRLSFAESDRVYIGKDSSANVRLPDRSVSSFHACVQFKRDTKEFVVMDNHSLSGTFVQIANPLELRPISTSSPSSSSSSSGPTEFKIGRTSLSIKVSPRRSSLLNMIQLPQWGSSGSNPSAHTR